MPVLKHLLIAAHLSSIALASLFSPGFSYHKNALKPRIGTSDDASLIPQTVFLPWDSPFSRTDVPSIRGSIAGQRFTFPVHTGSTGVLIGEPLLPTVKLTSRNPKGWEFHARSGLLYSGQFIDLNITFYGANTAVSQVPVLVVTKVVNCPEYDANKNKGVCPPRIHLTQWNADLNSVTHMGVGFGHNTPGNGLPYSTPAHNPFLNVKQIGKDKVQSMRTGYMMSTKGVYLGLTSNNTLGAAWTKLQKMASDDSRAWAPLSVSFTQGSSKKSVQGQALIDTRVAQMYIQSSPGVPLSNISVINVIPPVKDVRRVKAGTKFTFAFPDFQKGVAGYDFEVGDEAFPSQPAYVSPFTLGKGPYVNTGRNILYGFSIVFDAVAGRFGFICDNCKA